MLQEVVDGGGLSYAPCRYGMSRMFFRGPKRRLDEPYFAFVGGTETFGKFINHPFPALTEQAIGHSCVNFGCVNGGVDAFVNDATIMTACHDAKATVVQVMGANYLSNRFYSVHPRRNDRFLRASSVLQAIYPEVDFSDFTFVRHMLGALHDLSPERFDIVVSELRAAWVARMRSMLSQIGPDVVLLWFSRYDLTDQPWQQYHNPLAVDPLFITKSMIDELQPQTRDVVIAKPSEIALAQGTRGMFVPPMQSKAAQEMMGMTSHHEASAILGPVLQNIMKS